MGAAAGYRRSALLCGGHSVCGAVRAGLSLFVLCDCGLCGGGHDAVPDRAECVWHYGSPPADWRYAALYQSRRIKYDLRVGTLCLH